jgi:hypothetical protein
MLAGHGAVEFEHQIGDRVGDRNHLVDFARFLEIDERTDVHATDGAMAVVAGDGIVACDHGAKAFDELGQFGRLHRRVFDKGDGLFVSFGA